LERSLQAQLLPSETNVSVADGCKVVQLIHLDNQMMWERFCVGQTLKECN
jgi:hypothetical protein